MKFHIITIFPEAFTSFFATSIIGKAQEKGLFEIELYKLNDFSKKKFKQVDDKAFGMHGQVLSPEPLSEAIEYIFKNTGSKLPAYYFSPRGKILSQKYIERFAEQSPECILVCGHYEGIDERIIELYNIEMLSIGNYILSGGELAAQVFLDAVIRHIPGVLGNPLSLEEESFSEVFGGKKEHPVYTRPAEFHGLKVPEVLTSGNHEAIEKWKHTNLS
ncbi:tRNA (guanosine(37)-N1)-methyltransferase TrmD [Candidatus Gracilibacteria bacterium]|nr:tRNA (guanosine(37)-N1)-methyltransferase TrmD [Candidatus Gracilibacteria bacterium]